MSFQKRGLPLLTRMGFFVLVFHFETSVKVPGTSLRGLSEGWSKTKIKPINHGMCLSQNIHITCGEISKDFCKEPFPYYVLIGYILSNIMPFK